MSFQSLSAELAGAIPGLSPILADSFVNRAWADVRRARASWSFLQADGALVCPAQVTTGTLAITQYQTTVTANAAASTALLALNPTPGLTAMQIRFAGTGNTPAVGQVYSITSVNSTNPAAIVLTLDRVIVEATNATSGYQCYRCYVTPPMTDFLSWQSVVDMVNGWPLGVDRTSTFFDLRDPQRQAQGQAYYVGAFQGYSATQTVPRYELWPHPTSGQTLYVRIRRQGEDFVNLADTQPLMIPDSLILLRAQGWYAYPWAAANVGRMPDLRGVGWVNLMLDAKKMYFEELIAVKRTDDEQQLQTVFARGHGLRRSRGGMKGMWAFPIDSNFIQSHLVNL